MLSYAAPRAPSSLLRSIRPKIIFGMIEAAFPNENVPFHSIMPPTDIGGLTLLEGALIASLVRLRGAQNIFEFGTYKGATSVLLAMNSTPNARITTLDIDPAEVSAMHARNAAGKASVDNDHYLRGVRANEGAPYIMQADQALRDKIRPLLHDSLTLDLDAFGFRRAFDLIFIDGGHDYATVKSDSEKAFEMADEDAVIIWHDYGSPTHTDVTAYVNKLAETHPVTHVEASMLAISWSKLS
ncbi:MAG: class I SAM-dependent methyltransferase [Caulobacterales bacterium]